VALNLPASAVIIPPPVFEAVPAASRCALQTATAIPDDGAVESPSQVLDQKKRHERCGRSTVFAAGGTTRGRYPHGFAAVLPSSARH